MQRLSSNNIFFNKQMLQDLKTLPLRKRGPHLDKARKVKLTSNLYEVSFDPNTVIFNLHIRLEPNISFDNSQKYKELMNLCQESIESVVGPFVYAGRNLFTAKAPSENQICLKLVLGKQPYVMTLKLIKELKLCAIASSERSKFFPILSFFNNMVKNFFSQMGYIEIGQTGKYFNLGDRQEIRDTGFMLMRGYSTSFNYLQDGFFLRVDPASKIVNTESVLDLINSIYKLNKDKQKFQKRILITQQLVNKMVLTNYGKGACYTVEDVIFDQTVDTLQFLHGGQKISLFDYFKKTYGISVENRKQPLLKATPKKNKQNKFMIYLVPELVLVSGIPQNFDERKRKQINEFTNVKPSQKIAQIKQFMDSIRDKMNNFSPQNIENSLSISLNDSLSEVNAIQLDNPTLKLGRHESVQENKIGFFNLYNKPIYKSSVPLKITIFCPQDFSLDNIKQLMMSTCKKLAITYEMNSQTINFRDSKYYLKNLEDFMTDHKVAKKSNVYWIILPGNCKRFYPSIKQLTLQQKHMQKITQISLTSTLSKKNFPSIFTKILLQMAAKAGNKLWVPQIQKCLKDKKVMFLALQSYADAHNRKKEIIAYCATMDNEMSEYFSDYYYQDKNSIEKLRMKEIAVKCLENFMKKNGCLPDEILIMKNGTTKHQVNVENQIVEFKNTLKDFPRKYQSANLSYIIVDKSPKQKFFFETAKEMSNPLYGTLVNSQVVNDNDFYLISHNCNRGTAKPTYYKVVYSESELEEGAIQELIYIQCFNYMNWSGPVRIPGVMQYAKKLAEFVGQHIHGESEAQDLTNNLYFI